MKNINRILFTASAVLALAACDQELPPSTGGAGAFTLNLNMTDTETATKSSMSKDELLSSAKVSIYKADFSGKVREYIYSQIPQYIYLPEDDYRVDVVAGEQAKAEPAVASWDQVSYKGSSDVKITTGTTSTIAVTAKVNSIISNVSFDNSVHNAFGQFSCTVSVDPTDDSASLVYTSANSDKDGFFISSGYEPSLYWTFTGSLKGGNPFTKSGEIPSVEPGKRYNMRFRYTDNNGSLGFDLVVDDSTNVIYDNIIFEATSTGVSSSTRYEVWAGHFTAHADVDETQYDKDNVYFEVRRQGSTDAWTRVAATRDSESSYSAKISGLTPSTTYEYRLAVKSLESGEEEYMDATSTITTESAPTIPNGSFETTSNAESSKYKSFYDPSSSDPDLQTAWWGSGNAGSTLVGSSAVICYPDTGEKVDGTQSACLESRWVVVKFAAGNLFSGRFGELESTSGGTVYFGRPFTARPTALRFWMKYTGGKINHAGSNVPEGGKEGNWDKASIRIALGTWDYRKYGGDATSPVLVNTTDTSTFVDYTTDASTIAYAEKIVSSDSTNPATDWIQVTLPLEYRDTNKYPTHIIISCASSMYGDYFAGYDESKLWLDGMELLYE